VARSRTPSTWRRAIAASTTAWAFASIASLIERSAFGVRRWASSLRRRWWSAPSLFRVVPRDNRLVSRFSATPWPETKLASSRNTALHSA
jgi:hypothetical protein